jgi:hypothetical protein
MIATVQSAAFVVSWLGAVVALGVAMWQRPDQ